jgi:hypothetical protein
MDLAALVARLALSEEQTRCFVARTRFFLAHNLIGREKLSKYTDNFVW